MYPKPQHSVGTTRATGEATTIKTSTPHTQATSLSPTLDTPTQLVQGEGTEAAPPTTAAQTKVPGAIETDTTPAQLDQLIQQVSIVGSLVDVYVCSPCCLCGT